jgi:drug/metabolite transporter (DMT)-like permease
MRARRIIAFTAVYLVWGSMYLAMRVGVESIPPLMLAALRSLIAGAILYGWGRLRGGAPPTPREWRVAAVVGGLLFFGAHGSLFWAVQRVPSGVASLFVATIPIWMTITQYLTEPRRRVGGSTVVGIAGGAFGIFLLVGPGQLLGGERIDPVGAVVLVGVAIFWTLGSAVAKRTAPRSLPVATGSYLLAGGTMLAVASVAVGEPALVATRPVLSRSVVALGYLVVFGSVITFSAYNWLLRHTSLSAVSTYAYVNPLVAVLLGWGFAGEPLSPRVLVATAVILSSVALSLSAQARFWTRPARV